MIESDGLELNLRCSLLEGYLLTESISVSYIGIKDGAGDWCGIKNGCSCRVQVFMSLTYAG